MSATDNTGGAPAHQCTHTAALAEAITGELGIVEQLLGEQLEAVPAGAGDAIYAAQAVIRRACAMAEVIATAHGGEAAGEQGPGGLARWLFAHKDHAEAAHALLGAVGGAA